MEKTSSYIGCMAATSWLPACRSSVGFRHLGREVDFEEVPRQSYCYVYSWRHFIRRLVKEGRKMYVNPKPLDFHYDEDSYAKNFDEGFEG